MFSDGASPSLPERKSRDSKQKVPEVFSRMLQSHTMQFTNIIETSSKDGLTINGSKRGGDVFSKNHSKWLQTVGASPEVVRFKFVPITSLLNRVPRSGFLSHAINLYLRYKPAAEDLQFFLEFQVPRQWAPLHLQLNIRKTEWAGAPSVGRKSSIFTNLSSTSTFEHRSVVGAPKQLPATLNSRVYPDGPPVPIRSTKMREYVDTEEVSRGSHDMPGHWLVIAAKLVMDDGKIGICIIRFSSRGLI
ncbi:MACPF domain-containing protein-like protein [Tanacetum coccineum]